MFFKRKQPPGKKDIICRAFWFNKKFKKIAENLTDDEIRDIEKNLKITWEGIYTQLDGYDLGFIAGYCYKKKPR
jgi:hypothetical protein